MNAATVERSTPIQGMQHGQCIRCGHTQATRSGECNPCGQVSTLLSFVHLKWRRDELANLAQTLRGETLADFISRCEAAGLTDSHRIGVLIERLSYPARVSPETLKTRLCDAIGKYLAEIEGIEKWEAIPGNEGGYMARWIETIGTWFQGGEK